MIHSRQVFPFIPIFTPKFLWHSQGEQSSAGIHSLKSVTLCWRECNYWNLQLRATEPPIPLSPFHLGFPTPMCPRIFLRPQGKIFFPIAVRARIKRHVCCYHSFHFWWRSPPSFVQLKCWTCRRRRPSSLSPWLHLWRTTCCRFWELSFSFPTVTSAPVSRHVKTTLTNNWEYLSVLSFPFCMCLTWCSHFMGSRCCCGCQAIRQEEQWRQFSGQVSNLACGVRGRYTSPGTWPATFPLIPLRVLFSFKCFNFTNHSRELDFGILISFSWLIPITYWLPENQPTNK